MHDTLIEAGEQAKAFVAHVTSQKNNMLHELRVHTFTSTRRQKDEWRPAAAIISRCQPSFCDGAPPACAQERMEVSYKNFAETLDKWEADIMAEMNGQAQEYTAAAADAKELADTLVKAQQVAGM